MTVTPAFSEDTKTTTVLVAVQDANSAQAPLLSAAIDQYKAGKYEEALVSLQGVKADALADADKQILADTIASCEQAVQQRKGARADFNKGEEALANGKNEEASNYYKSVISNTYADEATKKKAQEQLAVVGVAAGTSETDLKAGYESAVADYKAHNYDSARGKFQKLVDAGYKAPWFGKSPREYIELIGKEDAPKSDAEIGRVAYLTGRDQYKKGDWIAARQNFNTAVANGYKPGWFDESPANYLAKMDKKEQADAAKAAAAAVAAATVTTPAVVESTTPTTETPKVETSVTAIEAPKVETPVTTEPPKVETTVTTEPPKVETTVTTEPPKVESTTPVVAAVETPATQPTSVDITPVAPVVNEDKEALTKLAMEQQAKIDQAKKVVEDAKAAENAQNLNTAAALYSQALELDPGSADALAGKARTLHDAGLSPVKPDLATVTEQKIIAQKAAINFDFNRSMNDAANFTANGDFDKANSSIEQAVVASKTNPGIFTNEELQSFDSRVASARVARESGIINKKATDATATAEKARNDAKKHDEDIRLAREQAVAQLIADARRLTDQGKYDEALKTIDQILVLDQHNYYADGARQLVADQANLTHQKKMRLKFIDEMNKVYNEAVEMKIPYSGVLSYPTNWPDISKQRDQTVREESALTKEDSETVTQLENVLPPIDFNNVSLHDAIQFLRELTQANMVVDEKALTTAGVDPASTFVTLSLKNVKFSKVLNEVLKLASSGATSPLGYNVDQGVITISTQEVLQREVDIRTYDVRDLILTVPNYRQSNDSGGGGNTSVSIGGGQDSGDGGGGNADFGASTNNDEQNQDTNANADERLQGLEDLIKETVAGGTWTDSSSGTGTGSMTAYNNQLVVTQTPKIHEQIGNLLAKLRAQRSLQVSIETRFLSLQKNYLEDVGLDFDFYMNDNANPLAGLLPGTSALPTNENGRPVRGFGPISVTQNSASFTQASTLSTGVAGNLAGAFNNPNLQTTITAFLDDFQATMLIRATEGNQNITNVTAPRITLFNGQTSTISIRRDIYYVASLTPVVASGATAYRTRIASARSGIQLTVTATVSADRKYVTLNLSPTLTRLNALNTFQALGGTTTVSQGVVTQSSGGFVQLPDISIQSVRTSVSVPDGGTLLLGGATVTGEIEREAGVPILSKIPFLKRAFTNRSSASDETILLILVKPTIIIQREVEQENFPLLTSRTN